MGIELQLLLLVKHPVVSQTESESQAYRSRYRAF